MKIETLFNELKEHTKDKEAVFADSGIKNCFDKMQYGFFPLGLGILTDNNKTPGATPTNEIKEGGVMVLGNDFGTVPYVRNYTSSESKKIGEVDSVTIRNFLNKVDIDKQNTFFTNFYLGVRRVDGEFEGTTMTKRMRNGKINKLESEYKKLCYDFFKKQLELFNPRVVICLGNDVKCALIDAEKNSFNKWLPKSGAIKNLYVENGHHLIDVMENPDLGKRKYVIITHPSYLVNFKPEYIHKLNSIIKEKK